MPVMLSGEVPWYKCGYAANALSLFEGVARMINETFSAIFGADQTDVFAVFMVFLVVAIVAGLLLYMFRKMRK